MDKRYVQSLGLALLLGAVGIGMFGYYVLAVVLLVAGGVLLSLGGFRLRR